MKRAPRADVRGQVLVFLLFVLVVVAGGLLWLNHMARDREKSARAFAREAADRLARHFDQKFLDRWIAPEVKTLYPPSFRERLVGSFRQLGVASPEIDVTGDVLFSSRFFDPRGYLRAHVKYPNRSADIDLVISQPRGWWQIDRLLVTWNNPPEMAEAPAAPAPEGAEASPLPAATP